MNLVEKYRPKNLDEVVGQGHIVRVLKKFEEKYERGVNVIPHMLFVGEAGVGKTTVAKAFANELGAEILDLNASDERGIDVMRSKVKDFCRIAPLNGMLKIVFLDEADSLTTDAQNALRRMMEDYARTTVFILSVNYLPKIIPPIRNRCAIFRFKRLTTEQIKGRLIYILQNEGVEVDNKLESAIDVLAKSSDGSLRFAINQLNTLYAIDSINYNTIMDLVYGSNPDKIDMLYDGLKNGDKRIAWKVGELLDDGYQPEEIFERIIDRVIDDEDIDRKVKTKILMKAGDYAYYLSNGYSPKLQVRSLLALLVNMLGKR